MPRSTVGATTKPTETIEQRTKNGEQSPRTNTGWLRAAQTASAGCMRPCSQRQLTAQTNRMETRVSEYDETSSSFTELCNCVDVWNKIMEWFSKDQHALHVRTLSQSVLIAYDDWCIKQGCWDASKYASFGSLIHPHLTFQYFCHDYVHENIRHMCSTLFAQVVWRHLWKTPKSHTFFML